VVVVWQTRSVVAVAAVWTAAQTVNAAHMAWLTRGCTTTAFTITSEPKHQKTKK